MIYHSFILKTIKSCFYTILLYQICGNEIVYIKNNAPYATCHIVTGECFGLDELRLVFIRQTSHCSAFKKFNVME